MHSDVSAFIDSALSKPESMWEHTHIAHLSRLRIPEVVFAGRRDLLLSDIHHIWASWFIESLYDPVKCTRNPLSEGIYAIVYSDIREEIDKVLPLEGQDARAVTAGVIAKIVCREIRRRQTTRTRRRIDRESRRDLIDAVSPNIRCWICGYAFSAIAIDRFLNGRQSRDPDALGYFVDCFKPAGVHVEDREIEVDHLVPYSQGGGGGDNLAIACGWCNRHKGAFSSVYDQALLPVQFKHPSAGMISLPRPFWVVRLLATRQKCEFGGGCSRSTRDTELTVALRNGRGAANPANLLVVCEEHDQMSDSRLVFRDLFKDRV